ncbi:hypothetical protein NE865_12589 [Phthorimaea operculella]|nr:hypothetical protein NE865_12589 [Phthorimaea operculella]
MDKFDLKVALGLLPSMTDSEENTKTLIDAIEYYSSTLDDATQPNLISFVLKTRLSQSAKLKLENTYGTVKDLTKDMRKHLLPQKSATAIQAKMHSLRQNEKSVEEFGKELSEIFVDLTISQADGDASAYKILRPLNEKTAIKRFADGLRNRRLSTIITARDFSTLKDAIQAAKEADGASTSGSADVMGMYRQQNRPFPNRPFRGFSSPHTLYRGHRGNYNNTRGRSYYNRNPQVPMFNRNFQQRGNPRQPQMSSRGNSTRGKYGQFPRKFPNNRNVNYMSSEAEHDAAQQQDDTPDLSHFFRA